MKVYKQLQNVYDSLGNELKSNNEEEKEAEKIGGDEYILIHEKIDKKIDMITIFLNIFILPYAFLTNPK